MIKSFGQDNTAIQVEKGDYVMGSISMDVYLKDSDVKLGDGVADVAGVRGYLGNVDLPAPWTTYNKHSQIHLQAFGPLTINIVR